MLEDYGKVTIENIIANMNCTKKEHPCWQDISFRARQHLMTVLDVAQKEIFRIDVDLKIERVPDGYENTNHALFTVYRLEQIVSQIKAAL